VALEVVHFDFTADGIHGEESTLEARVGSA
jgi:hypothetical protein